MSTVIRVSDDQYLVRGTDGDDEFKEVRDNHWIILGPHTLHGGRGNDYYSITSETTIVEYADGGVDTIVSSTNYKLSANVENLYVWGSSAAIGNDGDNTIVAGGPSSFINGGGGNDLLTGGGIAADVFQFDAMSGRDTIMDWGKADTIRLGGYGQFHDFDDVNAALTQVGSNVVLKLDDSNDITLLNTKVADLGVGNFQYKVDLANSHLSLSFSDEFNTFDARETRTSPGTWSTEQGDGRGSDALESRTLTSNGERQIYVDPGFKGRGDAALGLDPFSVKDGVLTITGQAAPEAIKDALYGYDYTSGYISTRDSFAQTYGYFEARMELPAGTGTWPAFWMFRKDGYWPPELDVLESWNDTTAVQTLHTKELGRHTMDSASTWVPDGDTAFHTYGVLWTPETITWTIDGVEVFSQETPADMHSPMYMVLNLAISNLVDDPNFFEQLKIDYVRAYQFDELPESVKPTTMGAIEGMPDGFNEAYYKANNPDVVAAGIDPLHHYEFNGKQEGRLPYDGAVKAAAPTDLYLGAVAGMPDGFNPDYYAATNPDVVTLGLDLLIHYTRFGKAEGRLPYDAGDVATAGNDVFLGARPDHPYGVNYAYYAMHNPDVVAAGLDLYEHYEQFGRAEGRLAFDPGATALPAAGPVVDIPIVLPATPVVPQAPAADPDSGAPITPVPGSSSHPYWGPAATHFGGFNLDYYRAHNPDVVAAGVDPLQHYLNYGKAEGRLPYDTTDTTSHAAWGKVTNVLDGFNADYYSAQNPDVVLAGLDPLYHYTYFGKAEGRSPYDPTASIIDAGPVAPAASAAPAFDADYYALHNPDVMLSGMNPQEHYQRFGKAEGRLGFDDGSGTGLIVGSGGGDLLVATTAPFEVLTGGAGNDVFKFAPGMSWDTITDFDVAHDKIDASALFQAYGAPTVSDLSWTAGSMAQFAGGETIFLLDVSAAQAQSVLAI